MFPLEIPKKMKNNEKRNMNDVRYNKND